MSRCIWYARVVTRLFPTCAWSVTALLVLCVACVAAPSARADGLQCALTSSPTPSAPSVGHPCWTDVTRYPFGSDGNPVDAQSTVCQPKGATPYGPGWGNGDGDFASQGGEIAGNPPCYLQVNSLAFRAWNRGLAATGQPALHNAGSAPVAYGVWLFNGTNWFPDPTFPGSATCPGSTILWAGKLDYWLIGSSGAPQRTLCRFDGVNLVWEPLSLPAATVARLPWDQNGNVIGGITSGACYAWNNCWFFGDQGIQVHWDGQSLSDSSAGLGASPWLEGDFTGAAIGTDPSGNAFGVAVTKSSSVGSAGLQGSGVPLPAAPDGSPPAQLFGSHGGTWVPLPYSPPSSPRPNDPFTTDLTMVSADSGGDAWVAGDPAARLSSPTPAPIVPAPLQRLTVTGGEATCPQPGTSPFTAQAGGANGNSPNGFTWHGLSTFPDGSALAGGAYGNGQTTWTESAGGQTYTVGTDNEPVLVHAVCGQTPVIAEFRRPDPLDADQTGAQLIPADYGGWITAVASNASNDAWAATTDGTWVYFSNGNPVGGNLMPHVYRWTDGQPPDAPAGDDNEPRPSLFTLDPPVYTVGSPTIVVTPSTVTTTQTPAKTKSVHLPPAIYAVKSRLIRSAHGNFTLYISFKVRRPVSVGVQALRGRKVVASSGVKRFTGHSGSLALRLDRRKWPTHLRFVGAKV